MNQFIRSVSRSNSPLALVFDVGANTGDWGAVTMWKLAHQARNRGPLRRTLRLVSFEPQQALSEKLIKRAASYNATHLPRSSWSVYKAAAWTKDTANLTFFKSSFSEASSLVAEQALAFSNPGPWCGRAGSNCAPPMPVRGVDFARLLVGLVASAPSIHDGGALEEPAVPVLIKLDVEAAEYDLLPKLIVSGALCMATHLFVEWHLNAISPPRRLQALALRHSLGSLLSGGCAALRPGRPPPIVEHDEDAGNNFGQAVPGLAGLQAQHQPTTRDYAETRPYALAHAETLVQPAAAFNESERQRRRDARRWLDASYNGVCEGTDVGRSDCEAGRKGSWPLPAGSSRASWTAAFSFCERQCAACARCRYISVSPSKGDCSWFHRCDLSKLKFKASGFRTGPRAEF